MEKNENILCDNFLVVVNMGPHVADTACDIAINIINNIKGKLYIINYNQFETSNDKLLNGIISFMKKNNQIKSENELSNKIVFEDNFKKDVDYIMELYKYITSDDYIMIIGGERLIPYVRTESLIETQFSYMNMRMHSMDKNNWKGFAINVDRLFTDFQDKVKGMIMIVSAYENCSDAITKAFINFNSMSIVEIRLEGKDEKIEIQEELLKQLENNSVIDFLNILDDGKEKLGNEIYNYFKCIAYLNSGDREKSIEILENNYDNMENEKKKILADLYLSINNPKRAFEILIDIHKIDKYEIGLMFAILKSIDSMVEFDDKLLWINEAMRIDGNDPRVLELVANYYNSIGKYKDSAKIRRKISLLLNDPFHELIARILDLIESPPAIHQNAIDYINSLLLQHPHLASEANFRLGNYFTEYVLDIRNAYLCFKNVESEIKVPKALEAAKARFEILKNITQVSEALEKDISNDIAFALGRERVFELLNNIRILACENNGCSIWRDFIENTQSINVWEKFLYLELMNKLTKWKELNFDYLKRRSFIEKLENDSSKKHGVSTRDAINLLRNIKIGIFHGEKSNEELKQYINSILGSFEINNDKKEMCWAMYFSSITLTLFGDHQDANNYALTILSFAEKEEDLKLAKEYLMLGLMAWGNSHYRTGNQIEGIACIIAAFELGVEIEEVVPFLEDACNIVYRFLQDNKELIDEKDKDLICIFFREISKYNEDIEINALLLFERWKEGYSLLYKRVFDTEIRDGQWAGYFVNLINTCTMLGNNKEAYDLITTYSTEAIKLLMSRIDIRYKILLSWAEIIIYQSNNVEYSLKKATELLELAISDVENRRRVYFKAERASIGDSAKGIYTYYIHIQVLLYNDKNISMEDKTNIRTKIESTLMKLSPRAINEQKHYYLNKNVTKEIQDVEQEYKILIDEIMTMKQKNKGDIEGITNKTKRAGDLNNILILKHPHYMSLPTYNQVSIDAIKESLKEGELFYQFIKTKFGIVYILLTFNEEKILTYIIEPGELEKLAKMIKTIGEMLYQKVEDKRQILQLSEWISEALYFPLIEKINEDVFNKIYVMADSETYLFSPNLARMKDDWLIEDMDSIINLVDYNMLINTPVKKDFSNSIIVQVLGNKADPAINSIMRWLENYESEISIKIKLGDDFNELVSSCIQEKPRIVIIIGHGISDINSTVNDGATGILGNGRAIDMDELEKVSKYVHDIILISCSVGTSYQGQNETNTGVWGNILEKVASGILMCKWNMNVNDTIKILNILVDNLFEYNWDLARILIIAQRQFILNYDNHPGKWAGLEYWIN
ncbi:MAG: tetratricopeptide repeat protein [Clostridium sp.]|uniref:tetratricopeptide repeat protein n=1 Tax=Clostridium sp. TaxID=1506 RepID=UPI003D6D2E78